MKKTNNLIAFAAAALFAASPVIAHEGHEHGEKDELASGETKKITVEGKVTSRDGVNMIENAVIQK